MSTPPSDPAIRAKTPVLSPELQQELLGFSAAELTGDELPVRLILIHAALSSAALHHALLGAPEPDRTDSAGVLNQAARHYRQALRPLISGLTPTLDLLELSGQPSWCRLLVNLSTLARTTAGEWRSTLRGLPVKQSMTLPQTDADLIGTLWREAPPEARDSLLAACCAQAARVVRGKLSGQLLDLDNEAGPMHLMRWTPNEEAQIIWAAAQAAQDDDGTYVAGGEDWEKLGVTLSSRSGLILSALRGLGGERVPSSQRRGSQDSRRIWTDWEAPGEWERQVLDAYSKLPSVRRQW